MVKEPAKTLCLVISAIKNLRELKGSTSREISHYLSSVYDIPSTVARRQIQTALKRGVAYGILRKNGGHYILPTNTEAKSQEIAAQEVDLLDQCRKRRSRRRRGRRSKRAACKCKSKSSRRSSRMRKSRRSRGCKPRSRRRSRRRKCKCGGLGNRKDRERTKRARSASPKGHVDQARFAPIYATDDLSRSQCSSDSITSTDD